MILTGGAPTFPPDGFGTCGCCKREGVEVRTLEDGRTFCADLQRCALAYAGAPAEILSVEIPDDEVWVVQPGSG